MLRSDMASSLTHPELVTALFELLEPKLAHGQATGFAEGLGIKQPTFSSYRIGRRLPSLEVCQRLAEAVDHEVVLLLRPKGTAPLVQGWGRLSPARQAALAELVDRSPELSDRQFNALQAVWSAFGGR